MLLFLTPNRFVLPPLTCFNISTNQIPLNECWPTEYTSDHSLEVCGLILTVLKYVLSDS